MEAQAQGIVDNFRDLLCELGVGIEISGQNPKAPGNWRRKQPVSLRRPSHVTGTRTCPNPVEELGIEHIAWLLRSGFRMFLQTQVPRPKHSPTFPSPESQAYISCPAIHPTLNCALESLVVSPLDLSLDDRRVAIALVEIVHVSKVDPAYSKSLAAAERDN